MQYISVFLLFISHSLFCSSLSRVPMILDLTVDTDREHSHRYTQRDNKDTHKHRNRGRERIGSPLWHCDNLTWISWNTNTEENREDDVVSHCQAKVMCFKLSDWLRFCCWYWFCAKWHPIPYLVCYFWPVPTRLIHYDR